MTSVCPIPEVNLLPQNPRETSAFLMIADISGYTRFTVANAKAEAHGQAIIARLMTLLVSLIHSPFEIAKLEGDGVFFLERLAPTSSRHDVRERISNLVVRLFTDFNTEIRRLQDSAQCRCTACRNIDQLKLKVVGHVGTVIETKIANFRELAGLDVILVHRLQKNRLRLREYALFTNKARELLALPEEMPRANIQDEIEGFGKLDLIAYDPAGNSTRPNEQISTSLRDRYYLAIDLWFSQLRRPPTGKRNMPLSALTILLTPVYLPVSAVSAAIRSWRKRSRAHPEFTN